MSFIWKLLGGRRETKNPTGRATDATESLKALMGALKEAQESLDITRTTVAAILSSTKGMLEGKHGPPEAWLAVASDLATVDGFVAALNATGDALHLLGVIRYREGDIPPEIATYLEKGLSALQAARQELLIAWGKAYQTELIHDLPGIEQFLHLPGLEAKLTQCERLARAFLES